MIIAQHLLDRANGALAIEPEVAHPTYSMFNSGGVEVEVGEFLHSMVRVTKPMHILETGTHLGVSAAFMALGLEENGFGRLTTIEINPNYSQQAKVMLTAMGIAHRVGFVVARAEEWIPTGTSYDIILLDTELQFRFGNMIRLWPLLAPGGFLVIHDLHVHMGQTGIVNHDVLNGPYGTMPAAIEELIRTHELQSFHFRTPRGLYVAQKASLGFYSTKVLRGND